MVAIVVQPPISANAASQWSFLEFVINGLIAATPFLRTW